MRASDDVAALTALERSFGDLTDAGRTAALVVRRGDRVLLDVACGVDDDGRPFTSTTSVFLYSAVEPVAALTVLLAAADGAWREQWTWTPGDMGALPRHPPELLDAQVGNSRAGRGLVAPAVTGYGSAHDLAHLWSWWTGADGAARLGVDLQSASLSAVLTGRDHVLDREVAWGLGPQVDEDDIGMGGVGGTFGGHLPGPGLSVGFTTADLSPPGHADVLDAASTSWPAIRDDDVPRVGAGSTVTRPRGFPSTRSSWRPVEVVAPAMAPRAHTTPLPRRRAPGRTEPTGQPLPRSEPHGGRTMNRHRKLVGSTRVVMGAVAAVALLLGASPVAAHETGAAGGSTPDEVSGTFVAPPPMPVGLREAGGNCFAEVPGDVFVLDGALDGELVLDLRLHFFGPCSAIAFPARFDATGTFTGSVTVGGQQLSGSFDVVFGGRIDEQPIARGRMTIGQGSGGLEGIHGVVDLEGIPGVGGTYAGRVLLAPGT